MKTRIFTIAALAALFLAVLLLGCALEPQSTASLNINLPQSRGPTTYIHYLLYEAGESLNFYTPIDAAHAGSHTYGIVTTSTGPSSYTVTIEAVEPKRYKLRVHAHSHNDPNMYYMGNNICGPWAVTNYDSIQYFYSSTDGTFVFDSGNAFDVVAGSAVDVACNYLNS